MPPAYIDLLFRNYMMEKTTDAYLTGTMYGWIVLHLTSCSASLHPKLGSTPGWYGYFRYTHTPKNIAQISGGVSRHRPITSRQKPPPLVRKPERKKRSRRSPCCGRRGGGGGGDGRREVFSQDPMHRAAREIRVLPAFTTKIKKVPSSSDGGGGIWSLIGAHASTPECRVCFEN
ncbi:hypothetical protein LX32DRAFT_278643 [Colletotrichum zoysiae]|uniref:Uncharacterized protein n=1 Tax=Colletotrichum zoysiae TaxID=1216348 RepID=A0AAD9H3W4_9PEZI|nr:hypothetical protein LX32DRAFT_278643 [Colletotrichum zoysiae]